MYTAQPKNMLVMNILEILKKHSDAEHPLNQKEIIDLLQREYQMTVDRKAIKRNLMNLIDFGYNLEYKETNRTNKKGEQEVLYSDWYLERDFTDAELRLLIDSLLFSKHIPYSQCKELIGKLTALSSKYFEAKVKHIRTLPEKMPNNKQIFYNIEILDEAISKGKQVEFQYNDFGIDKKLHPRVHGNGKPKKYIINPYQMAATNGRYYLIANYDRYDNISHYRVDRISEIKILDTPAKKQKDLSESINLPKHMAEHIYMFSGESERVTMRIAKGLVGDVIDWFGKEVSFHEETEDEVTISVVVNLQAMRYWAMQYARFVEVLKPAKLREQIKNDLLAAVGKYKDE
ncbi:MAG: WYL domain-containing protein [Phascolarctobacterium sp.]|nr:WYL domain-containing protein [Phascolarctobacterium sp.]